MKLRDYLEEMRGKDGSPENIGGTDICICPECGAEVHHDRKVPCNKMKCPECGATMTGKGTPGSEVSEAKMKKAKDIKNFKDAVDVLRKNTDFDVDKDLRSKYRKEASIIEWYFQGKMVASYNQDKGTIKYQSK
jgi:Zn-finger nucleic acid-binding protein